MAADPEASVTALALRPQSAVSSPLPDRDEWLTMTSIANALAKARGFIPAHFQGDGYKVLAAIMYGRDLGLSPTVAIQHIIVIDGKATADAQLIGYLIRRAGHKLTDVTTATASTVKLVRADDGSSHEATFTIEMAKRAGLVRSGGAWEKYPESMVYARALTMVARKGAQDALLGVVYTPEELGAEVGEEGNVTRLPVSNEFQGEIREVPSGEEIPPQQASPETRAVVEAAEGAKESPPSAPAPSAPAPQPTEERARRGVGPRPRTSNVVQVPRTPATPVGLTEDEEEPAPAQDSELLTELRTLAAQLVVIRTQQRNRKGALNGEAPLPIPPATPNLEADQSLRTYLKGVIGHEVEIGDLSDAELHSAIDALRGLITQVEGN